MFTLLGRPTRPLGPDPRAFRAAALAMRHRDLAAKPAAEEGFETGAADDGPMSRSNTFSFFSIIPIPVLAPIGLDTMVAVRFMKAYWHGQYET